MSLSEIRDVGNCGTDAAVLSLDWLAGDITWHHEQVLEAAETGIKHAVVAGLGLMEAKERIEHGDWAVWLADEFEFSARTARSYMFVAKHRDRIENQTGSTAANLSVREALRIVGPTRKAPKPSAEAVAADTAKRLPHICANTGEVEWYTPASIIKPVVEVLGGIDLDPASCVEANEIVRATKFYSAADDGLKQPWRGSVWLNPPYAQPLIGQFADKLLASLESGDASAAIVLVNNATETKFFQALASKSAAVCFPEGRIRFWHPNRNSCTPLQGQALFYFGPDVPKFFAIFGEIGVCLRGTEGAP